MNNEKRVEIDKKFDALCKEYDELEKMIDAEYSDEEGGPDSMDRALWDMSIALVNLNSKLNGTCAQAFNPGKRSLPKCDYD